MAGIGWVAGSAAAAGASCADRSRCPARDGERRAPGAPGIRRGDAVFGAGSAACSSAAARSAAAASMTACMRASKDSGSLGGTLRGAGPGLSLPVAPGTRRARGGGTGLSSAMANPLGPACGEPRSLMDSAAHDVPLFNLNDPLLRCHRITSVQRCGPGTAHLDDLSQRSDLASGLLVWHAMPATRRQVPRIGVANHAKPGSAPRAAVRQEDAAGPAGTATRVSPGYWETPVGGGGGKYVFVCGVTLWRLRHGV